MEVWQLYTKFDCKGIDNGSARKHLRASYQVR